MKAVHTRMVVVRTKIAVVSQQSMNGYHNAFRTKYKPALSLARKAELIHIFVTLVTIPTVVGPSHDFLCKRAKFKSPFKPFQKLHHFVTILKVYAIFIVFEV